MALIRTGILTIRIGSPSVRCSSSMNNMKGNTNTINIINSSKYKIRLATKEDIPCIRDLNVSNLPENYSIDFYKKFMSKWPQLMIIAESIEGGKLIGYALARVEQPAESPLPSPSPSPLANALAHLHLTPSALVPVPLSIVGHVTSIAVESAYRGNGLGKALMSKLHLQLKKITTPCRPISLFWRLSYHL
jgi:ribosomal protein S18 acetylase RimI-like enzyme